MYFTRGRDGGSLKLNIDGDDNFVEGEEGKSLFICLVQDQGFIDLGHLPMIASSTVLLAGQGAWYIL